jgi:4-hydroxy-4-methyl-2-oxoglutarate aldolase
LVDLDLPIYARGVVPTACPARAVPVVQVPIMIGSAEVRPGDLVLGDDDGLVVATEDEVMAVIDAAEAIQRREEALGAQIAAGSSLFGAINYEEHVAAVRAGRDSRLTFF